jgi:hypothetical protein
MTEQEWRTGNNPTPMLEFVRHTASERKLRLFAVACCRRVWGSFPDEGSRRAVEVAEQYADGATHKKALAAARSTAADVANGMGLPGSSVEGQRVWGAAQAARHAARPTRKRPALGDDVRKAAEFSLMAEMVGRLSRSIPSECLLPRCRLLRCIFGNPFRQPPPLPSAVLAWNDGTVRRLAGAIYEDRQMAAGTLDPARLAILADALLDAGSDDEDLIGHCRSEGPHYRGCWALDCLLGKE